MENKKSNKGKTNKQTYSKNNKGKPYNKPSRKNYKSPKSNNRQGGPRDNFKEEQNDNRSLILEGRNAVLEAIKSKRSIDRILVQDNSADQGPLTSIVAAARARGLVVRFESKSKLDLLSEQGRHQGVLALVAAYEYVDLEDILEAAREKGEEPFIIILDKIEDPHNLGAIIRTAHQAGCHGVIIPKRNAAGLTNTVVRASAGAIEYMKIAKVTNINRTIDALKEEGVWIIGSDTDGQVMYEVDMKGAIAIVIGNEGEGISALTKKKCDFIARIPMYGKIDSLNVSVATGVIAYEAIRQRKWKNTAEASKI